MNPDRDGRGGSATSAERVLELEALSKRYRGARERAVSEVDLSIAEGEVVAVVGESGCGKTTLLRLIAGLEAPDAGVVRIAGEEMAAPGRWTSPERRGVGMVFQDFALFPHLRVRENVAYGVRGVSRRERRERRERAESLLTLVGLAECGDRYPHELSGGQQQRVALARALAPAPRILLLDEPFSNLDAALKATVREEVAEILRRSGATALLVVHDGEDVMALADRVAVMRRGRIRQVGTPHGVYNRPRDEYVARFFGETNVLRARRVKGGFETPLGFVPSRAVDGAPGPVTLSVRPEHLELSLQGGRGRPAVVRRTRYHGIFQRVLLSIPDAPVPHRLLRLHASSDRHVSEGDIVYVRIRADAVQVLAADGAGGE